MTKYQRQAGLVYSITRFSILYNLYVFFRCYHCLKFSYIFLYFVHYILTSIKIAYFRRFLECRIWSTLGWMDS